MVTNFPFLIFFFVQILHYISIDIFTQLLININIPYTKNTNNKNISKKQTFSTYKFNISLKKR